MKKIKCIVFALFIIFVAGTAESKVYLDVYGKTYKKITIGVPSFQSDRPDRLRMDMSELLNHDLDFSGFFIVAPNSLLDKELSEEGIEKKDIKFTHWRSLGIELLCKARFTSTNGEIALESYLYDTLDGTLLLGKRYRSRPEDWRKMVHHLADDILLAVTGEKGIMGSRVLFVSGTRRNKDVYIASMDGQSIRQITNFENIIVSPSLSPDGRFLAYTSYKEGKPNLFIMDLETGKDIHSDRGDGMKLGTSWLGKSTLGYAKTAGNQSTVYTFDASTRQQKTIFSKEGIVTSPSFSPDGTKMVFVSDMFGSPQIFIKDLPSGEPRRLTYSGNYNTSPSFSPKGDLIVFTSKINGSFEICTMNIDGSNQRVLTSGGINDSPHFSPCGRYIIYSSKKGAQYNIYTMLFNGENKRLLNLTGKDEEQPKFVP